MLSTQWQLKSISVKNSWASTKMETPSMPRRHSRQTLSSRLSWLKVWTYTQARFRARDPAAQFSPLTPAAYPQGKYKEKYSAENSYGDNGQRQPKDSPAKAKEDDADAKIARLTSVYEKAKSDFEAVSTADTIAKLEAARFLRDTAENTILYFREPNKSSSSHAEDSKIKELIADLETTGKMAQASVVTLSGGRKRRFDLRAYEVLPRGPRGGGYRGKASNRRGRGTFGGRAVRDGREASPRQKWHDPEREARRNVEVVHQHPSRFSDHPDASRDYPKTSRDYHDSSRHYPEPSRDYYDSSHDHPSKHRRISAYTRPVDSYHPEPEPESVSSHAHPYEHRHHQNQRRFPEPSTSTMHDYGYTEHYGHRHDDPYSGGHSHSLSHAAGRGSVRGGRGGTGTGARDAAEGETEGGYGYHRRRGCGGEEERGDADMGAEYQPEMGY